MAGEPCNIRLLHTERVYGVPCHSWKLCLSKHNLRMCGTLFSETFVSDNDGKFYVFVLATVDEMDTLKGNIKLILNNQELMVKAPN